MSLPEVLCTATAKIPECLAAGYVDVASGMLMAINTVDSHPQEIIELIAAATADLFNGENVTTIEDMFRRVRGTSDEQRRYFQEIVVNSDNLVHIFIRGRLYPEYVAVFVCRKSVNLGMALTRSRLMMPELEALV